VFTEVCLTAGKVIGQADGGVQWGEVINMARFGPFPFVPNMEDCRKIVKTRHCTCYIMDTCCRDMTREDKERADRQILQIYVNEALRREASGPA